MTKNLRVKSSEYIDETNRISFKFNGKTYHGFKGDTLASALLANDVHFVGRSFKKASDLPEICKRVDEPHSGSEVHFGTVRSVDPFLECYEVDICLAGKTFIRYFDYEQLRPSNYTIDNDLSGGESSSNDVFVNGTPRVKQAGQRQSTIPSKPKLVPKKNKKKGMFNYFCFKFLAK